MSNNNAQAPKSAAPVAPVAPVETVKPIQVNDAIAAVTAQFAPDARVTAYQITSIANVVLELLTGTRGNLLPQPTYNMTKSLRVAAQVETGEQAIKVSDAIAIVGKLVKKAQGGAVVQGARLDLNAIAANAMTALKK